MKKIFASLLALTLVLSLTVPAMAASVRSGGEVGGTDGSAPTICAKFETPDDSSAQGTQINPTPGGPGTPDFPPLTSTTSPYTGVVEGWRQVNYYVIVGSPAGVEQIARVDATINYSDNGDEKFQLVATRETPTSAWVGEVILPGLEYPMPIAVRQIMWGEDVDMNADGIVGNDNDMPIQQALMELDAQGRLEYGPGQVLGSQTSGGILFDIYNDKQIVLELTYFMHFHQPAMLYCVTVSATDRDGYTTPEEGQVTNCYEFMPMVSLIKDFDTIDFDTIKIGEMTVVYGDALFGAGRPTVWNVGNYPAKLNVMFTPMTNENGKKIWDFDISLDQLDWSSLVLDRKQNTPAPANEWVSPLLTKDVEFPYGYHNPFMVSLAEDCPVMLLPCHPAEIDFSVDAPVGTQAGTYSGNIYLELEPYPEGCGEIYPSAG